MNRPTAPSVPGTAPTPARPASFVLPWYRFRELDAFEPWERGPVVEDAAEIAATHPAVLVAWGVTLGALALAAALFTDSLKQLPMAAVLSVAVAAFAPMVLVRRRVVHALVVQRARQRREGSQAAG